MRILYFSGSMDDTNQAFKVVDYQVFKKYILKILGDSEIGILSAVGGFGLHRAGVDVRSLADSGPLRIDRSLASVSGCLLLLGRWDVGRSGLERLDHAVGTRDDPQPFLWSPRKVAATGDHGRFFDRWIHPIVQRVCRERIAGVCNSLCAGRSLASGIGAVSVAASGTD